MAATAANPPERINYLSDRLPAELRVRIYAFALTAKHDPVTDTFTGSSMVRHSVTNGCYREPDRSGEQYEACQKLIHIPYLLHTCKRVREEASPIFFKHAVVEFTTSRGLLTLFNNLVSSPFAWCVPMLNDVRDTRCRKNLIEADSLLWYLRDELRKNKIELSAAALKVWVVDGDQWGFTSSPLRKPLTLVDATAMPTAPASLWARRRLKDMS